MRERMCLYITLPAQGGLFLNPKLRRQLVCFCRARVAQSFPRGCPGSAGVPCISQPFLGVQKHVLVPRLEEKPGCERSPSPQVLLGFSARRCSPAPSPRPRSQQGRELPAGECWKYGVSCAANDFLRQTIGAAGSYRSPLPIPASAGGGMGPRGAALPGAWQTQSCLSPNPGRDGCVPLISGAS